MFFVTVVQIFGDEDGSVAAEAELVDDFVALLHYQTDLGDQLVLLVHFFHRRQPRVVVGTVFSCIIVVRKTASWKTLEISRWMKKACNGCRIGKRKTLYRKR